MAKGQPTTMSAIDQDVVTLQRQLERLTDDLFHRVMQQTLAKRRGRRSHKIHRLTAKEVPNLLPGTYGDGDQLYLRVSPLGTRHWFKRYTAPNGQRRDLHFGPWPQVTLVEARDLNGEASRVIRAGRDPRAEYDEQIAAAKAERLAAKKPPTRTFRQCAELYIADHEKGADWTPKYSLQWTQSLKKHVYPVIGDVPVSEIDTDLVVQVLKPIWTVIRQQAELVQTRIGLILGAAIARKDRQAPNPASSDVLRHLLPRSSKARRVQPRAAMAVDDTPAFMLRLRQEDSIVARALELTILTAARTSEIRQARRSEFDLGKKLWTIPRERMKSGREHRVPLTDRAIEIVAGIPQTPGHLLWSFSQAGMINLLAAMGHGHLTVHGFRSTFADWCTERTTYPAEMREMALAHKVGNATEQAYRRTDLLQRRFQLMDDWAAFCDGGTVVPLAAD